MRRPLLALLVGAERAVEAVLRALHLTGRRHRPPELDPYLGYATPEHWVARGRVLARLRRPVPRDGQGTLANLRQMLSLFLTAEAADVPIRATDASGAALAAVTDEEGYFTLLVPRPPDPPGGAWGEVRAAVPGGPPVALPVQVARPDARLLVVSDLDDTVILTGAWTLWRNLWTTFTGSLATRTVFPDAVALLRLLSEEGRNPLAFVSSSPWNLHGFLESLLRSAGAPRAPLFLRDIGIARVDAMGEGRLPGGSHGAHKGSVIDRLLAAHPTLPVWLVGDTGQHDAAIYAAAAARHPGRVLRVTLRRAGRDAEPAAVAALRARGIPVDLLDDYAPLLAELGPGPEDLAAPPSPGAAPRVDPGVTPGPVRPTVGSR